MGKDLMKIILFYLVMILLGMGILSYTQTPRYFPRDSREYVIFCMPDTITGHHPDSLGYLERGKPGHGCDLNRRGKTIVDLDYPVIKCNICYPEK